MNIGRIRVNNICTYAISEASGIKLRESVQELLKSYDVVELDFTGITMFTTPFFNASIGYFILKWGPEVTKDKIQIVEATLSEMGHLTLSHSEDNAIDFYNNQDLKEKVGEIVKKNTEN